MGQKTYKEISCEIALNKLKRRIPYGWDLNIYRGCEHGCKYCYAIYSHDYISANNYFGDIYPKSLTTCTQIKNPI
jgi:DNA repair photolyase